MPTLRKLSAVTMQPINNKSSENKNKAQTDVQYARHTNWKTKCFQLLVVGSALPMTMARPIASGMKIRDKDVNNLNPLDIKDTNIHSLGLHPHHRHHAHRGALKSEGAPQIHAWANISPMTDTASTVTLPKVDKRSAPETYTQTFSKGDNEPNSIILTNRGSQKQAFSFFKNISPYVPNLEYSYFDADLEPGETALFTFPNSWEGRVQKMTGNGADPATWGEFRFNGFRDLTFFDVSVIRGNNCAMVMRSLDGSTQSGLTDDLVAQTPNEYLVPDSNNNLVVGPTEPYSGGTNNALVAFYRTKIATGQEYIVHDDDLSTLGTRDHGLSIEIF